MSWLYRLKGYFYCVTMKTFFTLAVTSIVTQRSSKIKWPPLTKCKLYRKVSQEWWSGSLTASPKRNCYLSIPLFLKVVWLFLNGVFISFVCPVDVTDEIIFRFRISFDCFHAQVQGVLQKRFCGDQPWNLHHSSDQNVIFYTPFQTWTQKNWYPISHYFGAHSYYI